MSEDILGNLLKSSRHQILVTGGSGFVGSYLLERLGPRAINFDLKIGRDIFSADFEAEAKNCWAVIHLAVDPMNQVTNTDFEKTQRVLEVAKKNNLKVIFASSASVYRDWGRNSQRETDDLQPLSAYAQAKIDSEYLCAAYRSIIQITVLRYFNIYGKGQNPIYAGAISRFLEGLDNGTITVYGNGDQTRDFIRVEDVADITIAALDAAWDNQIVNVGTGKSISINELVKIFVRNSGRYLHKAVNYAEARPEIYRSCADNTQLRLLWGQPDTNIEEGIKKLIAEKYG